MSGGPITRLSAAAIAAGVARRQVTAGEVLEAHLDAIARLNPKLNAICTLAAERAREEAAALDARLAGGAPAPLLAGVPVAIKDIVPTAGIRTTWGSPLYRDFVPAEDALIVTRLRQAGAIVLGKTNVPEFAAGVLVIPRSLVPFVVEEAGRFLREEEFCRLLLARGHTLKEAFPLRPALRPLFERWLGDGTLPDRDAVLRAT